MDKVQAPIILAALFTMEAIIVSVFGNLYSVYASFMREGGSPVCFTIRKICYVLAATTVIIAFSSIYLILEMHPFFPPEIKNIHYVMYVIVVMVSMPAIIIANGMWKDGRAN